MWQMRRWVASISGRVSNFAMDKVRALGRSNVPALASETSGTKRANACQQCLAFAHRLHGAKLLGGSSSSCAVDFPQLHVLQAVTINSVQGIHFKALKPFI